MPLGSHADVTDEEWIHLTEDEVVRWSGRPSRVKLLPAVAAMVVLVVLGIALASWLRPIAIERGWPIALPGAPLVLAAIGIAYGGYVYLHWLRLIYVITSQEIYVKTGLIARDVTQVPLTRVQNTNYNQSILERMLSYGTIHVYTAGTDAEDLVLKDVPNPQRINEVLTADLGRSRSGTGRV